MPHRATTNAAGMHRTVESARNRERFALVRRDILLPDMSEPLAPGSPTEQAVAHYSGRPRSLQPLTPAACAVGRIR